MNLRTRLSMMAYGTPEGVERSWDTRGRGRNTTKDYQYKTSAHLRTAVQTLRDAGYSKGKKPGDSSWREDTASATYRHPNGGMFRTWSGPAENRLAMYGPQEHHAIAGKFAKK